MPRALILLGHADPTSFNATLAATYRDAWEARGGTATLVRLADLSFDPVLRFGFRGGQALEPDLVNLRAQIDAADHVTWIFPTYWASPPAIVRAVVDRLFLPGWAFRYVEGSPLPEKLLAGRSSRVVTTMDSPAWWYALRHYRAIHGAFVNGTLGFVGFSPIETTTVYGTRKLTQAQRARHVARLARDAGEDLARTRRSQFGQLAARGEPGKLGP